MTAYDVAGGIAGLLALVAYIPYIIAILREQTKPNRATWFIWTVASIIGTVSYFQSGARETIWVSAGFLVGSGTIAMLSIKRGDNGWTWVETVCSLGATIGVALWIITRSPLPTLFLSMAIATLGAVPTMRKAYRDPSSENRLAWFLFVLSAIVNLFAVEKWTLVMFTIWIVPVNILLTDGFILALVLWPRKKVAVPT